MLHLYMIGQKRAWSKVSLPGLNKKSWLRETEA